MINLPLIAGVVLLLLGSATLLVAVIRTVGHVWIFGPYELWVLPLLGVGLIVLGQTLLR